MGFHGGIEIDGDRVRATVVEGTAKKYRVVDFVEGIIAGEGEDERRASLRAILGPAFSSRERSGLDVAAAIGADRTILREISVPYTKEEMIARTIRFEAESYIHSHSIDDLIIEFLKCSESDSGSRLVICALEKSRLGEELERFRGAGIDPVSVELDATALATAYLRSDPTGAEGSSLLVQIEPRHTIFVLIEDARITKVRSVWNLVRPIEPSSPLLREGPGAAGEPAAGEGAIEDRFAAIERSLSGLEPGGGATDEGDGDDDEEVPFALIPDDEYERFISGDAGSSGAGGGDGGAPAAGGARGAFALAVAGDPFDRIVLELERTFAGHLLGGSIDRLVVTGSEAAELDAVDRLGAHFEVEARLLPLGEVEIALPAEAEESFRQGGGVSFGLALRSLGLAASRFDLRKEEFRFERRFERLMPSLTLTGLLLCILSLVWMVTEHRRVRSYTHEIAILRHNQAQLFESFFDTKPRDDTPDFVRASEDRLKTFSGKSGGTTGQRMKQYYGAMEVLTDFYTAVERATPKIYPAYESFDFDPERKKGRKSTVKLRLPSTEDVQALTEALRSHSQIFDTLVAPKEAKEGGYDVTVELLVKADGR